VFGAFHLLSHGKLSHFLNLETSFFHLRKSAGARCQCADDSGIHNFQLLEVVEDADFGLAAPAVAVDLKVIVGRGDVAVRFLGFDVKADVAIIRMELKSVVGAALGIAVFLAFDFDFLFQRIFLRVVVHVPAEGEPEFVNEVAARLLFLIGRGQVEFLVGPEVGNQFFHSTECLVEARGHLGRCYARRGKIKAEII
jgi:hypothetical protein